jgi:hypothetical protein
MSIYESGISCVLKTDDWPGFYEIVYRIISYGASKKHNSSIQLFFEGHIFTWES